MRFNYFSELMKNAKIFIGNSSAGVREAPFIGIPSINIGTRQMNRAKSLSVLNCKASEERKIINYINVNWGKKFNPDFSYGNGKASEKFLKIINNEEIWKISRQKYFKDL